VPLGNARGAQFGNRYSMAKGIEFYRQYAKIDCLKNSYETQLFTERFNSLFDSLNRKYRAEGIKQNSKDFR
jgi:hypothetical protein